MAGTNGINDVAKRSLSSCDAEYETSLTDSELIALRDSAGLDRFSTRTIQGCGGYCIVPLQLKDPILFRKKCPLYITDNERCEKIIELADNNSPAKIEKKQGSSDSSSLVSWLVTAGLGFVIIVAAGLRIKVVRRPAIVLGIYESSAPKIIEKLIPEIARALKASRVRNIFPFYRDSIALVGVEYPSAERNIEWIVRDVIYSTLEGAGLTETEKRLLDGEFDGPGKLEKFVFAAAQENVILGYKELLAQKYAQEKGFKEIGLGENGRKAALQEMFDLAVDGKVDAAPAAVFKRWLNDYYRTITRIVYELRYVPEFRGRTDSARFDLARDLLKQKMEGGQSLEALSEEFILDPAKWLRPMVQAEMGSLADVPGGQCRVDTPPLAAALGIDDPAALPIAVRSDVAALLRTGSARKLLDYYGQEPEQIISEVLESVRSKRKDFTTIERKLLDGGFDVPREVREFITDAAAERLFSRYWEGLAQRITGHVAFLGIGLGENAKKIALKEMFELAVYGQEVVDQRSVINRWVGDYIKTTIEIARGLVRMQGFKRTSFPEREVFARKWVNQKMEEGHAFRDITSEVRSNPTLWMQPLVRAERASQRSSRRLSAPDIPDLSRGDVELRDSPDLEGRAERKSRAERRGERGEKGRTNPR